MNKTSDLDRLTQRAAELGIDLPAFWTQVLLDARHDLRTPANTPN